MRLRESEIRVIAHKVVAEAGFTSLPIDPKKIAESKDILLQPWEPKELGISGFLMVKGQSVGIGYSTAIKNEGFCNFTISHELGHYSLDGHIEKLFHNGVETHFSKSGFVSEDNIEREADIFATELLMPESLFAKALQEAGAGFTTIQKLSIKGKTSIVATALRYAELTDDHVAVIISSGDRVEYMRMSKPIRELRGLARFKNSDLTIPSNSGTATFNRNPEKIRNAEQTESSLSLCAWCNSAPDIEIQEEVIGLGHYGKTLTVLYTNESVDGLNEEDDEEYDCHDNLPSERWARYDRERRD